jgi:NAD+ synthase
VDLVEKTPSDGLCGKTDEDNLGFTYAVLDRYIRTGVCEDEATKELIDRKHRLNLFKLKPIPHFSPALPEAAGYHPE